MIRVLQPGDEAALEEFLAPRALTSMFLRSNARAAGLVDRGGPRQATYAAAFDGDRIVAVAAHSTNGILILQAPGEVAAVAREALRASGRKLTALSGPWEQVLRARAELGLESQATITGDRDALFELSLSELREPPPRLAQECRQPLPAELPACAEWRYAYMIETGFGEPSPGLRAAAFESVDQLHERGDHFVLVEDGQLVAYSAFNARLPEIVQVGGVWTPPALRGRGHARRVVAGSLVAARAQGATRAVLFTFETNLAAIRAYESLGFTRAGDYGLMFFR
jgi:RimJ/RimL family protein N-acetyltransferase